MAFLSPGEGSPVSGLGGDVGVGRWSRLLVLPGLPVLLTHQKPPGISGMVIFLA